VGVRKRMIETISSVVMIGFFVSIFGAVITEQQTTTVTDELIPTIAATVQNETLYIAHKRGYSIGHVFLYINHTYILDQVNFSIGNVITVKIQQPCMIELFDNAHNLLFYGNF
jgi:hypothetical protein